MPCAGSRAKPSNSPSPRTRRGCSANCSDGGLHEPFEFLQPAHIRARRAGAPADPAGARTRHRRGQARPRRAVAGRDPGRRPPPRHGGPGQRSGEDEPGRRHLDPRDRDRDSRPGRSARLKKLHRFSGKRPLLRQGPLSYGVLLQTPIFASRALSAAALRSGVASLVGHPPPLNSTTRDRSWPPTWHRYTSFEPAGSQATSRPLRYWVRSSGLPAPGAHSTPNRRTTSPFTDRVAVSITSGTPRSAPEEPVEPVMAGSGSRIGLAATALDAAGAAAALAWGEAASSPWNRNAPTPKRARTATAPSATAGRVQERERMSPKTFRSCSSATGTGPSSARALEPRSGMTEVLSVFSGLYDHSAIGSRGPCSSRTAAGSSSGRGGSAAGWAPSESRFNQSRFGFSRG